MPTDTLTWRQRALMTLIVDVEASIAEEPDPARKRSLWVEVQRLNRRASWITYLDARDEEEP